MKDENKCYDSSQTSFRCYRRRSLVWLETWFYVFLFYCRWFKFHGFWQQNDMNHISKVPLKFWLWKLTREILRYAYCFPNIHFHLMETKHCRDFPRVICLWILHLLLDSRADGTLWKLPVSRIWMMPCCLRKLTVDDVGWFALLNNG